MHFSINRTTAQIKKKANFFVGRTAGGGGGGRGGAGLPWWRNENGSIYGGILSST